MTPTFIISHKAAAAILGSRIVAFADAANNGTVQQATDGTAPLLGTSDRLDTELGAMCDVHRGGLSAVRLGGPVQAGDPLTADADGKAVVAAPASGVNVWIIGYANEPGAVDDIVDYLFAPSALHGA